MDELTAVKEVQVIPVEKKWPWLVSVALNRTKTNKFNEEY